MTSRRDRMPRRVFVRGTSGAGKTTLARAIAERLDLRFVEMDAIHHLPNWTERPREETYAMLAEIVKEEKWVIDGNYSHALDHHLGRADAVVWLDYGFFFVFFRLLKRTLRRGIRREELWAGNRESLWKAFFTRESILWWMVTTHHRRHLQCLDAQRALEGTATQFVRLRSARETDQWFKRLAQ